jgi:hypothetical protein
MSTVLERARMDRMLALHLELVSAVLHRVRGVIDPHDKSIFSQQALLLLYGLPIENLEPIVKAAIGVMLLEEDKNKCAEAALEYLRAVAAPNARKAHGRR